MSLWLRHLTLSLLFVLVACSQKAVDDDPAFTAVSGKRKDFSAAPESKSNPEAELKSIFFDYDKADIRDRERSAILENAGWLKKHPEANVQIEGHCDERGTREYNYKLGERRAEVAKQALVNAGVSPERISTVSYGALDGQNEKTWPRHRKAVFVILYTR